MINKQTLNLFVLLSVNVFFINVSYGQFPGCPDVDAGNDTSTTCSDPCVQLTASPFETGATDSYVANSIPHAPPIDYDEPGGNPVSVGSDDVYSSEIVLPFTFCFYGQNYNSVVVGSNGAISFDANNANGYHPYSFNDPVPSPNLVDAGNVFGVYHDIDPTVNGTVNWYILGTAPCRIFVVSYHELGHYSCTNLRSTFMMVLYETTNAIDVYVEEKETCTGWNSGNALIGIQNPAGTDGIAAPGRNTGPWTANTPEAWRFSPDGAPIYDVEWFEGTNSIGTGLTVDVCPTTQTSYTAVTTYNSCDGQTIVVDDTVQVSPPANAPSVDSINVVAPSCGQSNGEIEVDGSGGTPGYEFSIDGGTTFQTSGVFTGLSQGTYTITVEDDTGCLGSANFDLDENSTLELSLTGTDLTCFNDSSGVVEGIGSLGSGGYSYSINGGTLQTSGIFSDLDAGTYTILVEDSDGCQEEDTISIYEPNELLISAIDSNDVSCFGLTDGFIHVDATGGDGNYDYSIDGTNFQTSNEFNNIPADTFDVIVIDGNGCTDTLTHEIIEPDELILSIQDTSDVSCFGYSDGYIHLDAVGGDGNYEYSIDSTNYQISNEFDNLDADIYGLIVIDGNGCSDTISHEITEPSGASTSISYDEPQFCPVGDTEVTINGETGGTFSSTPGIVIDASTGTINLNNSTPGDYTIEYDYTNSNGCSYTTTANVTVLELPNVDAGSDVTICEGESWTVEGASGADTYSWNNGVSTGDIINPSVGVETYVVTGVDTNGCVNADSMQVTTLADPDINVEGTPLTGEPPLNVTLENQSTGASNFYWDLGDGNAFDTSAIEISNTYNDEGIYIVTLTGESNNGCIGSDSIQIIVEQSAVNYEIPNVLTPNNDGSNDYFEINYSAGVENINSFEIVILNRWGNVIQTYDNPQFKWNGKTKNGREVSDGTYFYKLNFTSNKGEEINEHGFVQVVRD